MLANGLIFLLGLFSAALAALIVAPILWRKAQLLARREFEATIPISPNELRAEFDRVRAEAALTVRRQEVLSAETREKAAQAEAERGRVTIENTELSKRAHRLAKSLEEKEEGLTGLRDVLATRDEDHQRLSKQMAGVRHEAELTSQEMEALARRFREITDIAEERKLQLAAAEARIERMSDSVRTTDRDGRGETAVVEKLTGEIAALERMLRQERAGSAALQDKVAALVGRLADREEELARLDPAAAVSTDAARAPSSSRSAWGGAPSADAKPSANRTGRSKPAPRGRAPALADEAEATDIRERISDIAARVIRMTALAEGPASPLADLLAVPSGRSASGGSADRPPTLAERVRLLAEADRRNEA